jgi:CheY-like chemotaxis protein
MLPPHRGRNEPAGLIPTTSETSTLVHPQSAGYLFLSHGLAAFLESADGIPVADATRRRFQGKQEMDRPTVLIADEESLIRWSLGERLRGEGYDVLEATRGSAVEALGKRVDLIILGCEMRDREGCGVLRQLKEANPAVPIILLTTCPTTDEETKAAEMGVWAVARKPFGLDRLVAIVKSASDPVLTASSYAVH